MGSEEARVRVELRSGDLVDLAKGTIENLLRIMGVSATVGLPEAPARAGADEPGDNLTFDIDGDDAGLLIGRRGETLSSFQFLVNFILSRKVQNRVHTNIDIEGYRARRYESLRALAHRMAERVANTGRPFTLEPMPARERRIVHLALSSHPRVTTESDGEGEDRKVTIAPKRGGRASHQRAQGGDSRER